MSCEVVKREFSPMRPFSRGSFDVSRLRTRWELPGRAANQVRIGDRRLTEDLFYFDIRKRFHGFTPDVSLGKQAIEQP